MLLSDYSKGQLDSGEVLVGPKSRTGVEVAWGGEGGGQKLPFFEVWLRKQYLTPDTVTKEAITGQEQSLLSPPE